MFSSPNINVPPLLARNFIARNTPTHPLQNIKRKLNRDLFTVKSHAFLRQNSKYKTLPPSGFHQNLWRRNARPRKCCTDRKALKASYFPEKLLANEFRRRGVFCPSEHLNIFFSLGHKFSSLVFGIML